MRLVNKYSTKTSLGCLSKGWYENNNILYLVKGNSNSEISSEFGYEPFSEVLASRLGKILGLPIVDYVLKPASDYPEITTYNCDFVSVCRRFNKDDEQLVSYCKWADLTNGKEVKDYFSYYLKCKLLNKDLAKMLVFDAITGNPDRHLNNFDIVVGKNYQRLSPIFDNGACMLACKSNAELKMYKGIGFDKAKPFKPTHTEQAALVKRRLYTGNLFSVNVESIYEEWVASCSDIFNLMDNYRAECIKNYIRNRLVFLNDFNGGETNALDVF